MIHVIALSGKAGSGKDHLAEKVLVPMGYFRWALAWPMKNEACGHGFIWPDVHIRKPQPVRDWLQKRGTENGWKIHGREYWCKIAEAWMQTMLTFNGIDKFVFTDVRFPHEVEWVEKVGGRVIRIVAPERSDVSGLSEEARAHSSETALDNHQFQWFVHNDPGHTMATDVLTDIVKGYEERMMYGA